MHKPCSIYVHLPFCKKRCYYCGFVSSCDFSLADAYFDALGREIERYSAKYAANSVINSVYLGGGTPTAVGQKRLDKLFCLLESKFCLSNSAEITVEGNPESMTRDVADCLAAHGVNRVSLGLQSANDSTLKKIGRLHDFSDFLTALDAVRSAGIANVNADVIIGLPEIHAEFISTVNTVASLPVSHVSAYALELHQGTKLFDMVQSGAVKLYEDDELADWYDEAAEILSKAGFDRYEISNFAKHGCESLHNLNYWRCGEYFGFGAAAHGYIDGVRYANADNLKSYILGAKPQQTAVEGKDASDEYVMLGLRLANGISKEQFFEKFGRELLAVYPKIADMVSRGFIVEEDGFVKVPAEHLYVLNGILCEIL